MHAKVKHGPSGMITIAAKPAAVIEWRTDVWALQCTTGNERLDSFVVDVRVADLWTDSVEARVVVRAEGLPHGRAVYEPLLGTHAFRVLQDDRRISFLQADAGKLFPVLVKSSSSSSLSFEEASTYTWWVRPWSLVPNACGFGALACMARLRSSNLVECGQAPHEATRMA